MAQVSITISFDTDDRLVGYEVSEILDEVAGFQPSAHFGVEIDGEHRDPDSPTEGLFS